MADTPCWLLVGRIPCWLICCGDCTRIDVFCISLLWAQDVPTEYWRTHGVEAFNGKWYTLVGPITPWYVKSATHASKKQTFCSFTKGFAGFCAANDLKLGETLQFTKVAPLTFEVRKV